MKKNVVLMRICQSDSEDEQMKTNEPQIYSSALEFSLNYVTYVT